MTPEPIIIAFSPELLERLVSKAKEHKILRGEGADWKRLRQLITKSGYIHSGDIQEFTIHLRVLADHYLAFATAENGRSDYASKAKDLRDTHETAIRAGKTFRGCVVRSAVKTALEKPHSKVKAYDVNALMDTIGGVIKALEAAKDAVYIPKPSPNRVKHAQHALVQTFKALWEHYTGKSIRGNRAAYSVARQFFVCAGCLPRKGGGGDFSDIPQLFKQARMHTKHLGPLTPIRRLTPEEKRVFADLAF